MFLGEGTNTLAHLQILMCLSSRESACSSVEFGLALRLNEEDGDGKLESEIEPPVVAMSRSQPSLLICLYALHIVQFLFFSAVVGYHIISYQVEERMYQC